MIGIPMRPESERPALEPEATRLTYTFEECIDMCQKGNRCLTGGNMPWCLTSIRQVGIFRDKKKSGLIDRTHHYVVLQMRRPLFNKGPGLGTWVRIDRWQSTLQSLELTASVL